MNDTINTLAQFAAQGDAVAALAFTDAVLEAAIDNGETRETGTLSYWPEMGETRPVAQIECTLYWGRKYIIATPLELKGRGIRLVDKYTEGRKAGWNRYEVTMKAYEKLQSQYRIAREALLD